MSKTLHGKVHGRTIQLDEDPGVAEGQEVEVVVKVVVRDQHNICILGRELETQRILKGVNENLYLLLLSSRNGDVKAGLAFPHNLHSNFIVP